MTIPNLLTLIRISLIPLFILLFYCPWDWAKPATASVFLIAAITDWLDGFLARQLKQFSRLGAFMDPVADKLIVAVALVLMVSEHASAWLAIPAAIIVCREIAISALREWMAEIGKRRAVKVGTLGKYKTALQMFAILIFLVYGRQGGAWWWQSLGYLLLYVAVLLTLWSMFAYLRAAKADLHWSEDDTKGV